MKLFVKVNEKLFLPRRLKDTKCFPSYSLSVETAESENSIPSGEKDISLRLSSPLACSFAKGYGALKTP
jgi:hypothetical protein